MSKILIHFPVLLAFIIALASALWAIRVSYWILILSWQALSACVMLILDGQNREKRFKKILFLVNAGKELDTLPREQTLCGFFIRRAVIWESRPVESAKK